MRWFRSESLGTFLGSLEPASWFVEMTVAVRGRSGWAWAAWEEAGDPPDEQSRFDLASLSKPMMATLAVELDRSGRLALDRRVVDLWPNAPTTSTLGDLLRHRSRLQPWLPTYALADGVSAPGREAQWRRQRLLAVLDDDRWWSARGRIYSDLGYMLWGVLAEQELNCDLASLWRDSRVNHAGLSFEGGNDVRTSPIGTGQEVLLGEALGLELLDLGPPAAGQVQDGNARHLGRAAHAGLFGGLRSVCEWLESYWVEPPPWLQRSRLDDLTRPEMGGSWFRSSGASSCGSAASALAFGHTGFVGGAFWIDPASGRAAVCLANRRCPTRSIEAFRARLFTELLSPSSHW